MKSAELDGISDYKHTHLHLHLTKYGCLHAFPWVWISSHMLKLVRKTIGVHKQLFKTKFLEFKECRAFLREI